MQYLKQYALVNIWAFTLYQEVTKQPSNMFSFVLSLVYRPRISTGRPDELQPRTLATNDSQFQ